MDVDGISRKENVAERDRGAESGSGFGFERVVRVAWVPAGRTLGFGSRAEGGMVIVREEERTEVAWRRGERRDGMRRMVKGRECGGGGSGDSCCWRGEVDKPSLGLSPDPVAIGNTASSVQ